MDFIYGKKKTQESNFVIWNHFTRIIIILKIVIDKSCPYSSKLVSFKDKDNLLVILGNWHKDSSSWGRNFRSLFHICFSSCISNGWSPVAEFTVIMGPCGVSGDVIWYFWRLSTQVLRSSVFKDSLVESSHLVPDLESLSLLGCIPRFNQSASSPD